MQYGSVKLMKDMSYEAIDNTIKIYKNTTGEFKHLKSVSEQNVKEMNTQLRKAISVY